VAASVTAARETAASVTAGGERKLAPSFGQVAPDYSFQKVATAIREAIARGELTPGDRLPPQRTLQAVFGVSKVTLLEALRVLEADGLLRVQVGRNGGAVVLDAGRHSLTRALGLLVDMDQVNVEEVRELRTTVETQAARLAARRATPEQIERLEALMVRLETLERTTGAAPDYALFGALDLEFHTTLAEVCGNRLLHACMDVLYHHVIGRVVPMPLHELARLNRSLRRLLDQGVKGRAPHLAARAMERHLADSYRLIEAAATPSPDHGR
jgi:GntR family transcriptional repressor for pyruvate dehydrogenase complex